MANKIFQIIFCSIFLISCTEEKVILKEYSDNEIKVEWYYTEFFYQKSNDYIEITCPFVNNRGRKTTYNFPRGWIKSIDIKNREIHLDHTITIDIINKVIVKDKICGYKLILKEVD